MSKIQLISAESEEDFKAAFVCVTNGLDGYFESVDDLAKALRGCGRNPSQRNIDTYWRAHKKIGLTEFLAIAAKENAIKERDIIDSFRAIDIDDKGYITYQEFLALFTREGDALSVDEAKRVIRDADLNKDRKIDFREFSGLIMDTIEKAKQIARKKTKRLLKDDPDDGKKRHNRSMSEDRHHSRDKSADKHRRRPSHSPSFNDDDDSPRRHRRHSSNSSRRDLRHDSPPTKDHRRRDSRTRKEVERSPEPYDERPPGNLSRSNSLRNMLKDSVASNSRLNRSGSNESVRSIIRKSVQDGLNEKEDSFRSKKKSSFSAMLFESKYGPLSRNDVDREHEEPKNLKKWLQKSIKGGFYYNPGLGEIVSNSYALEVQNKSTFLFTIETYRTPLTTNEDALNMNVCLLIVKNKKQLTLKGLTENKIKNKWCCKIELSPGSYFLFPFTSGCHLKHKVDPSIQPVKLYQKDLNNEKTISRQFKDALSVIFDMCDLDSNGRMSREELSLYSSIASNESLPDEEWKFIGEMVGLERGELSKDAFMQLYIIEGRQKDVDLNDISNRMSNLGFNEALKLDHSCPYVITVASEGDSFDILFSEIYKLKTAEAFIFSLMETKGTKKQMKGLSDVNFYEYHSKYWSAIGVENGTRDDLDIEFNCNKSENCLSNVNGRDMKSDVRVKSGRTKIGMFLTGNNVNKDWIVRCNVSV